ncbi:MAG: GMC family oxidoreductase N-terminal domain-containing protein [Actinobacteria bacterium]|nr:GMC family oxidoreductase N-terminal domain-containing protein [Actinomycetota bacterium]
MPRWGDAAERWTPMRPRAVVIGAGSAGSVLASRISAAYDVTVIEAGRSPMAGESVLDASRTWSIPAELAEGRAWRATPGRAVGGSSVVNGGYFAAPAPDDLLRWRAAGGEAWAPERVLAHIGDLAARLGVHASPQTHPISRAFADACVLQGVTGTLLPLDTTFRDGAPRSVADAFLASSPNRIEVRSNCRAMRIVVENGRAVGVDVADADGSREVLAADEIVLCAGGFGTARLLLASGLAPTPSLRRAGIDVVADLPGVGAAFSDHPTVWIEWLPTAALSEAPPHPEDVDGAFPLALYLSADGTSGDDLEVLVCTQPPDADATPYGLVVGLQRPRSRGTVSATSAHPLGAPKIAYGYLRDPEDRAAMRVGVRCAAGLLVSTAFAGVVERLVDLTDDTLGDDLLLDAWILEHLGSASHTCGTAPMGPETDPAAVVDGAGRVRGIRGLRIADASMLPVVPSRACGCRNGGRSDRRGADARLAVAQARASAMSRAFVMRRGLTGLVPSTTLPRECSFCRSA